MANLVLAGLVADSVRLAHASTVLLALDLVATDLAPLLARLAALLVGGTGGLLACRDVDDDSL